MYILLVTPGLQLEQVGVLSVLFEQAFVIAFFENFAVVDNNDSVGRAYR